MDFRAGSFDEDYASRSPSLDSSNGSNRTDGSGGTKVQRRDSDVSLYVDLTKTGASSIVNMGGFPATPERTMYVDLTTLSLTMRQTFNLKTFRSKTQAMRDAGAADGETKTMEGGEGVSVQEGAADAIPCDQQVASGYLMYVMAGGNHRRSAKHPLTPYDPFSATTSSLYGPQVCGGPLALRGPHDELRRSRGAHCSSGASWWPHGLARNAPLVHPSCTPGSQAVQTHALRLTAMFHDLCHGFPPSDCCTRRGRAAGRVPQAVEHLLGALPDLRPPRHHHGPTAR